MYFTSNGMRIREILVKKKLSSADIETAFLFVRETTLWSDVLKRSVTKNVMASEGWFFLSYFSYHIFLFLLSMNLSRYFSVRFGNLYSVLLEVICNWKISVFFKLKLFPNTVVFVILSRFFKLLELHLELNTFVRLSVLICINIIKSDIEYIYI